MNSKYGASRSVILSKQQKLDKYGEKLFYL